MRSMRRRWFSSVPVGVDRHEYRDYQSTTGLGVILGFLGLLLLGASLSGLFGARARALEEAAPVSLAQLIDGAIASGRGVRVYGTLTAPSLPVVPGDRGREVIAGRLTVSAVGSLRVRRSSDGSGPPKRRELTLLEWEEKAPVIHLTDGVREVELAVPLAALPLKKTRLEAPRLEMSPEGGEPRPVAVELDGLRLPIPPGELDAYPARRIRARAELHVLEPGVEVTVLAAPVRAEGRTVLGAPVDAGLVVSRGTVEEVGRMSSLTTALSGALGVVLLVVAAWRLRRARRMYRDFVERSNRSSGLGR